MPPFGARATALIPVAGTGTRMIEGGISQLWETAN
jgi:hypothetical protein